jgi:hypothetical protein
MILEGYAHVSLQIDDFKSSVDDTMSFLDASLELTPNLLHSEDFLNGITLPI